MEDYFEGFSETITEWETAMQVTELDLDDPPRNVEKIDHRIHRFPRQDFIMYGLMPKMEQRTYIKCTECKLIFSPLDILYHKTCVGTTTPPKSQVSERKTKSRGGSSKKNLNNFPLPRVFAKTSSPNRAHHKDISKTQKVIPNQAPSLKYQEVSVTPEPEIKGASPDVPSPLSNDSLSLDGDSSSPKITSSSRSSKKSRKAKSTKEFNPDLHCGVIDAHKGPCLRSITCSNHRIQLKKLVSGRSKDIHQLITEKRMAKDRDLLSQSTSENDKVEQTSVVSTSEVIDTSQNAIDQTEEIKEVKHSEEFIDSLQDANHIHEFKFTSMSPLQEENSFKSLEQFDFAQIDQMPTMKEENYFSMESLRFTSKHEGMKFIENFDFTEMAPLSPFREEFICKPIEKVNMAEIQPMSPLEEDSHLVKEDTFVNVPITDDRPTSFKIPDLDPDVNTPGTHPKPIVAPNYGTKKFGGAVLFNKPQIQWQRNDILRAVNDARINFSLFDGTSTRSQRDRCSLSLNDSDMEFKRMRLDPNLNHFLMQCEIRKPFDEVLLEECLQENFGRNTFTSTIDFE